MHMGKKQFDAQGTSPGRQPRIRTTASDHGHRCASRKNRKLPTRYTWPPPNTCSEFIPDPAHR